MKMKSIIRIATLVIMAIALLVPMVASAQTTVPGHTQGKQQGRTIDGDDNGFPDAGIIVNGHYTAMYAYDENEWYMDYGDGRTEGSVDEGLDDLNEETLTVCNYVVNYRGDFGNDPSLDSGWIMNNINCSGYDDNNHYKYLIVHETDPRYTGDPDWAEWGTWEYHVYTVSGQGNLVRPENHVN